MNGLLQDLRYALRQLRKNPGFTAVAVITLALGIGANTVVFSVINSLLLHQLPIAKPEQVFSLESPGGGSVNFSYPDFRDLRDRNHTFSGLFAYRVNVAGLQANGSGSPAERAWLYEVTGNYFSTLGIQPYLGRFFTPEEDKALDANPVAVLSYAAWSRRFHADPGVVGKTIGLNGHSFTVIGVAPRGFQGTELIFSAEAWVPMSMMKVIEGWSWIEDRNSYNAWVAGRLKPGVTPQRATGDLNTVAHQLAHEFPDTDANLTVQLARPGLLGDMLSRPVRAFLLGLSLLAGLVLLAACMNLGSLLAAHVADRYRELGIRMAVGARRSTILRQLFTEAGVLALAGGAVGTGINLFLIRIIGRIQLPMDIPIRVAVSSDSRVLLLAFTLSLVTALVFGIAPARQIWRSDPNTALRSTQPLASGGRRWASRDVLLGLQVAICCVLVTACFTSLRGLRQALHTPLGFDPQNVILAGFDPALDGHNSTQAAAMQRSVAEQAAQLPGVISASYANSVPLNIDTSSTTVFNDKAVDLSSSKGVFAYYYSIAPRYLSSAGTQLIAGRDVQWQDDAHAPRVAIVNSTLAKRLFGTSDAVGRYFRNGFRLSSPLTEVVGVVEDGKYDALTEDASASVFFPIAQMPNTTTMLVVRSTSADPNLAAEIRNVIRRIDPAMPVYSLGLWEELLGYALFPARAGTVALTAFGILGLLLAITGIYGLAAYTVARRMRELGICIALGAPRLQVLRVALGRIFLLLVTGSAAGLALGMAAGRVLAHVVYQASADDPIVLISVAVSMMLVGIAATAIPARRATEIDPMRLLREE